MSDRRFRDMSLTEGDVEKLIHADADLCERKMRWDVDPFGIGEELDNTELVMFIDRAKRLLPLWRFWGLRDLVEKQRKVAAAWEQLWADRLPAINQRDEVCRLLEENGCDCDCECDGDGHSSDCEPCFACRVEQVVNPRNK